MPQPSWQTFPTGSPNTLIVVDVVNPMVIWAEDGGHTWEIVTPPDGTPHVFRDVEAFNPNHAVVLAVRPVWIAVVS